MQKIVVITGCLGLIGSHLTKKCLDLGWYVYGIDKCTYAANLNFKKQFLKNKNFIFIKKDIRKLKYLPDCDYVINVAAESHVGNSINESTNFMKTNILGVKNLLELIRNKPRNVSSQPIFLHFSTDEVYGDALEGEFDESSSLCPSNPYSASKAAADMLIFAWNRTHELKYIIVRPTNNYGIGQFPEKLIPLTIKMCQRQKKVRIHNNGDPVRNWLHADDTSNAVIKIIESNKINEIYNISGNLEQKNIVTVKKVLECFYNKKINYKEIEDYIEKDYSREGQDFRYAINDKKIKNLGWKPEKKFNEEIGKIVKYYKNNFKW